MPQENLTLLREFVAVLPVIWPRYGTFQVGTLRLPAYPYLYPNFRKVIAEEDGVV